MRRVTLRNALVAITLIAVIFVFWPRLLPRWIFAVGVTDASRTRLTGGVAVTVTVAARLTDTIWVVRSRDIGPARSVISGGSIMPNSSTFCMVWCCCYCSAGLY